MKAIKIILIYIGFFLIMFLVVWACIKLWPSQGDQNAKDMAQEEAQYAQKAPFFLNEFSGTTTPEEFCAKEVNYQDEYITGTSAETAQAKKISDFADCVYDASDERNTWLELNTAENSSSTK